MARLHLPFFRIFYSTTYTSLYIFQLVLLAITPGSLIYSAIEARALQYIFITGGVYILTALLVLFLYSSRLFSNRTVLAGVGKPYIPIQDGELSRKLRKIVKGHLLRSARVAYETRPRPLSDAPLPKTVVIDDPRRPPWGKVRHAGHAAPDRNETRLAPGVIFADVLAELPALLEARVVSLGGPAMGRQGLRAYMEALGEEMEWVEMYEAARFGGRPLCEEDFVALAAGFAEVLAGLGQPDRSLRLERRVSEESIQSARSVVAMTGRGRL